MKNNTFNKEDIVELKTILKFSIPIFIFSVFSQYALFNGYLSILNDNIAIIISMIIIIIGFLNKTYSVPIYLIFPFLISALTISHGHFPHLTMKIIYLSQIYLLVIVIDRINNNKIKITHNIKWYLYILVIFIYFVLLSAINSGLSITGLIVYLRRPIESVLIFLLIFVSKYSKRERNLIYSMFFSYWLAQPFIIISQYYFYLPKLDWYLGSSVDFIGGSMGYGASATVSISCALIFSYLLSIKFKYKNIFFILFTLIPLFTSSGGALVITLLIILFFIIMSRIKDSIRYVFVFSIFLVLIYLLKADFSGTPSYKFVNAFFNKSYIQKNIYIQMSTEAGRVSLTKNVYNLQKKHNNLLLGIGPLQLSGTRVMKIKQTSQKVSQVNYSDFQVIFGELGMLGFSSLIFLYIVSLNRTKKLAGKKRSNFNPKLFYYSSIIVIIIGVFYTQILFNPVFQITFWMLLRVISYKESNVIIPIGSKR